VAMTSCGVWSELGFPVESLGVFVVPLGHLLVLFGQVVERLGRVGVLNANHLSPGVVLGRLVALQGAAVARHPHCHSSAIGLADPEAPDHRLAAEEIQAVVQYVVATFG